MATLPSISTPLLAAELGATTYPAWLITPPHLAHPGAPYSQVALAQTSPYMSALSSYPPGFTTTSHLIDHGVPHSEMRPVQTCPQGPLPDWWNQGITAQPQSAHPGAPHSQVALPQTWQQMPFPNMYSQQFGVPCQSANVGLVAPSQPMYATYPQFAAAPQPIQISGPTQFVDANGVPVTPPPQLYTVPITSPQQFAMTTNALAHGAPQRLQANVTPIHQNSTASSVDCYRRRLNNYLSEFKGLSLETAGDEDINLPELRKLSRDLIDLIIDIKYCFADGSVKCRLNLTEDGNNSQAKRLARVGLPAMPAQMSEISKQSTPKCHLKSTSTPISCQMDELEVLKQNTSKLCPSVTVVSMSSAVSPVVNPNCGNVAPTKTPILSSCPPSISNDTATTSTASTNGDLEKDNYAGLSRTIKDSLEYPLPTKFLQLYDHFLMLEKVMSANVHKRNRLTFDDLAKLVERKTRKALPLSSFAKIMGVYPKAYNLSLTEKRETKAEKTYLENYCTPLAPSPTKVPLETRVDDSSVELVSMMLQECHLDHRNRLAPWRMACRRAIFRYKLYLLVAREHEVFLNKIGADKNAIPCGKFHEKFNLDSVADVIPAKMPEPPKIKLITDFLKTDKTVSKEPEKAKDTPKMSLYERITEKQRRRDEKLASARQNAINRRKYLEVLRDSAFFMIWTMFRTRYPKTSTLKLTDVISRICSQIKTLSASECTDVIDVLCEVVPRYFDVFTAGVNSCKYMRVNMQDSETDYIKILQTITAEHKLVESS